MNLFRGFIAGIVLPTILLPILLFTAIHYGKEEILTIPFIHLIPVIWGIWYLLYFFIFKHILPGSFTLKYFITGAVLGFLIAYYGVYELHIPEILDFEEYRHYPLVIAPIAYAIIWRIIVKPIGSFIGIVE